MMILLQLAKVQLQLFLNMRIYIILPILVGFFLVTSGCSGLGNSYHDGQTSSLKVPPDLNQLELSDTVRAPMIRSMPVSAKKAREFELFQSTQQYAEYQEFLAWYSGNGGDNKTSIEAFRKAQRDNRAKELDNNGTLVAKDAIGREVLLIVDTLDGGWNRVDTALINLNIQLLNSSKLSHTFHISHNVGRDGGTDIGWRNWATRLTGRAIYQLTLVKDQELVVLSISDRNGKPVVSPAADTLIRRIGAQLRTFAGNKEQFVVGGRKPLSGLSLVEQDNGRLQLIIPGEREMAWQALYRALRDANFSVDLASKDTMQLWIRYSDQPKKKPRGILFRLGLRRDDDQEIIKRYQIRLDPGYEKNTALVTLWNERGEPADMNDEVLKILFRELKG